MLIAGFSNANVQTQIAEMEKEYGIVLPDQYKDFLCRYNGGYTPKTKFKIGKTSSDLRGFYGMGDVKLSLSTDELEEWIAAKLLPIACDSFGNYIAIGVSDDNMGKIFFCDHEKGYRSDYITDSLKTFIRHCQSKKINESAKRSIKEREQAMIANGRGDVITDALRELWQAEIDKYQDMVQEEVILD